MLLHNLYQIPGGEDVVVQAEKALLEANGHDVALLEADNDAIANRFSQVITAANAIYSPSAKQRVRIEIAKFKPDIVHIHNFFPLLSPSVYDACQEAGVPVIQTLHNYRLLCPNAFLFRDGHACEDCLGKFVPWPGVVHACYRGSRVGSGVVAAMLTMHRAKGTWNEKVNLYIALTEFAREKFIEGGLLVHKLFVKPNFVPDPGVGHGRGDYALFVGRLSPEKGLDTLLAAWERHSPPIPLKIVGDGPSALQLQAAAQKIKGVEWMGRQSKEQVQALMKDALLLVVPSVWYEGCLMVILEAYAVGLPVIASNIGSITCMVAQGRTGLLFRPGDPEDLAAKLEWALAHPTALASMRLNARAEFEAKYTETQNYQQLMQIYDLARRIR
nr:glycosyltransferase family 4 protein [Argonema galeatum]